MTTPGATRFYRTAGEPASQSVTAQVAAGARLEWLPLETLAYDGYLKSQRVDAGVADYDRVTVLLLAAVRDGVLGFTGDRATLTLP